MYQSKLSYKLESNKEANTTSVTVFIAGTDMWLLRITIPRYVPMSRFKDEGQARTFVYFMMHVPKSEREINEDAVDLLVQVGLE